MIPRTYPSRVNSTTGRVEALVSFISSTTGLQRWVDYTPVAFVTDATPVEGSYDNDGYIAVADVGSTAGLQAGKDYIRVYLDPNATDAWRVNSVGFIPVGYSGIGGIPYALFANNEQGVWYDPSDTATLFQDSAGTTPVTAVEQPVGLMLDKSKGLVLGSELVTNGDFSNGTTGWVKGDSNSSISVVNGQLVCACGSTTNVYVTQTIPTVAGRAYFISTDFIAMTGQAALRVSGTLGIGATFSSALGTRKTWFIASGSTSVIEIAADTANRTATVDNISVRELPGNHAFQTTSTSRPVLSARVNQVLSSEALGSSPWSNVVSGTATLTPTNNAATAPNGTNTATKLDFSATADGENCLRRQSITVTSGVSYTRLLWLRSDSPVTLYLRDPDGVFRPVSVGVTWSAFSVSSTTASSSYNFDISPKVSSSGTSSALTVYAWGADLRVTNDAAGQPAYQRVNTATDYDTTGFKPYLWFDGTDDWLVTPSINFTSTDKMTVFAGVRKLSDAATGILLENSISSGTITVGAPSGGGANKYDFTSRGTSTAQVVTTSVSYNAPTTNVLTGIGDISGDSAILRVNGTQVASSTADQGTGNFGNYPLYIGRRGGTTLPFNGRIYGLIVRGAATTTATIQATETYMNGKTGAY